MKWVMVYRFLLVMGLMATLGGLLFSSLMWFALVSSLGLLCMIGAGLELHALKKEKTKKLSAVKGQPKESFAGISDVKYQEDSSPVSHQIRPKEVKKEKKSWIKNILRPSAKSIPKKEEKVEVQAIKQEAVQPQKQTEKKEWERLVILGKFIRDSLKKGFSRQKIIDAALQARWPKDVVEKALHDMLSKQKKKKLIVLCVFFIAVLCSMVVLNVIDMFLLPYWITSLKYASIKFYMGAVLVMLSVAGFFALKVSRMVKVKNTEEKVLEERYVKEIKVVLQGFAGNYETDLDKLYGLLQEKKKLRLNEVAKAFGVSKEEAEEWGKILKEQDLAELYYPAVGDVEIRWKSSKNIA